MWHVTVLDMETTLHKVAYKVTHDRSVPMEVRHRREEALGAFGLELLTRGSDGLAAAGLHCPSSSSAADILIILRDYCTRKYTGNSSVLSQAGITPAVLASVEVSLEPDEYTASAAAAGGGVGKAGRERYSEGRELRESARELTRDTSREIARENARAGLR